MRWLNLLLILLVTLAVLPFASADPSCGDTITTDTLLTGDLNGCGGDGLIIGANDVTLDCAGYAINSISTFTGVSSVGWNNVTIKDCNINYFNTGIYFESTTNSSIINSNAPSSIYGIYYLSTTDTTIINSSGSGDVGFYFISSLNNTITGSTGSGGLQGAYIQDGINNQLNGFNGTGWLQGIYIVGGTANEIINSVASGLDGILLESTTWNYLYGNILIPGGDQGIHLITADYNTLVNNIANTNPSNGFYMYYSNNNTFIGNTVISNGIYGMLFAGGADNNIISNTFRGNGNTGLYLAGTSNYVVKDNHIDSNTVNGIIVEDTIISNLIYNNFFNNTNNIDLIAPFGANNWNRSKTSSINIIGGIYLGGNYWTNPSGTGFSDTCTNNGQGICVENYTIGTDNIDYIPLTSNEYFIPINMSNIVPSILMLKQDSATNIRISCFKDDGNYCTGAICKLTIFNPDGSLLVNNGQMTYSGAAYFSYPLNSSQTHNLGEYSASAVCSSINNVNANWEYQVTPTGKVFSKEMVTVYIFFLIVCLIITFLSARLTINNPMQKDELNQSEMYNLKKRNEIKFYLSLLKKKMWIIGVFGIYLSILAFTGLLGQLFYSLGITELVTIAINASQILAWGLIPFIIFWIAYLIIFFYTSTAETLKYQFGGFRNPSKSGGRN